MILNRKYDELMKHIEVTPEMQERILKNIKAEEYQSTSSSKVIQFRQRKKMISVAACFIVLLIGVITIPMINKSKPDNQLSTDYIQSEIIETDTLESLIESVGFEIEQIDTLPFEVNSIIYKNYWNELAEVIYQGETQKAVYRKGIGELNVSGDYNTYEDELSYDVDGSSVVLKGIRESYTLAIWFDQGFSYSLSLNEGMRVEEWTFIIESVMKGSH